MSRFFLLLSFLTILSKILYSQDIHLKIIDSETKKALPFVNIIFSDTRHGTTANIDGELKVKSNADKIFISYLGYYSDTIQLDTKISKDLIVELKPKLYNLEEIFILAGENPANRIIQKVIDNRNINNPENLESFSFKSYNKMIFEIEKDTTNLPDSLKNKKTKFEKKFDDHHLLMLETVNTKEFIKPDKYNEEIVASKVSGFNDPMFSLIASQVQSFSFYNDFFVLLDKSYLNPISKGSSKKYLFLLEDTIFTAQEDSIYIISFRPRKGKVFDGLKGFLHINTSTYAIQSVVAEPTEASQGMNVSIQQNYQFIENKQWFPNELITKIVWKKAIDSNPVDYNLIANGKSYISDININPDLNKKDFTNIELKIAENANKKTNDYWEDNRVKPLSEIEQETYRVIDSIGKAEKLEKKFAGFETIVNGKIPVKFLDLPLNKIMDYNNYEGYRLGLGFMTNQKVSKYFSIGGYTNYGFKDKAWKYGGEFILNLHESSESKIHFMYMNDVVEKSGYQFLEKPDFTSTEIYRKYLIGNMDLLEKYQVSFSTLMFKYLRANIFINQSYMESTDDYAFGTSLNNSTHRFTFSEIGVQFRYAYNEKYMQTLRYKYPLPTKYPILLGNIIRGTDWFDGEYEYTKYEAKITKSFKTKSLGKTKLTLVAGLVDGNIPISKLYNGHGSYQPFSIEAENSFGTMRMGEFYSSSFFSLFFKHDFGSFFKTKLLSPKFAIVQNYGIASLSNKQYHFDSVKIQSYEKGYYESGLLINNILNTSYYGLGAAIFYRYGPYAFDQVKDNIAYKLTFTFGL